MQHEIIKQIMIKNNLHEYELMYSNDSKEFILVINKNINNEGLLIPSVHKMSKIKNEIESQNINIVIIVSDGTEIEYSSSLKIAISKNFEDRIRNIYVSNSDNKLTIYIEPKSELLNKEQTQIEKLVSKFFDLMKIEDRFVIWLNKRQYPTKTAILSILRSGSPMSLEQLIMALETKGFQIPENKIVTRMLDKFRISKEIIRRSDGGYILSLSTITRLSTKLNRESPDIKRALAISRYIE